jgi:hypothetical protein
MSIASQEHAQTASDGQGNPALATTDGELTLGKLLCQAFSDTFNGGGWAEPPEWGDFDEDQQHRWQLAAQRFAEISPPIPAGWRETLNALAVRFLTQSNAKKQPQWQAKAYAHAYAGVVNAIQALEALEIAGGTGRDPSPTGQLRDEPND